MRTPASHDRVRRLVETTAEGAAAELFLQLCRASPAFRHWLWEDFARDQNIREALRARLRRRNGVVRRFAELSEEGDSWREELRRLQVKVPRRIYGGLTWPELEKLIASYRAGKIDLGAFVLAHELRAAGRRATQSPLLARAALEFIVAALSAPYLLRQLETALTLTQPAADRSARRAALGYSDWWKLHTLFYILRHPQPAYSIRELRAHLARLGLAVSVKDLQRFCTRHGLARDMRAGRPRTRPQGVRQRNGT